MNMATADPRLPPLLDRLIAVCKDAFGQRLTGVYLHGSLAFGDFFWESSDIDLLAVTAAVPDAEQKEAFLRQVLALDPALPKKGLEFSLLLEKDCRRQLHPMPYLLHFSNDHKARCRADLPAYAAASHGLDYDLAGHITVLRAVGRTLWGAPLEAVFAQPRREDHLDSVLRDVTEAAEELAKTPVYGILNLCRTLALAREGLVCSKIQGGRWALDRVPQRFRPVIRAALACQRDGTAFQEDIPEGLGQWFLEEIRRGGETAL